MKTNDDNTETAAPEAPQDEYEYFDMVAKKYPLQRPKLPPNEEAEYLRRLKEFRECRRDAGRKIDPETAEVRGFYGQILDPYEIDPLLPEECQCGGWNHFARSPGSDIWVEFGDLPAAIRDALRKRPRASDELPDDLLCSRIAYPGGQ
jgi:hypothetical protein